jgi:hypothetical protein
VTELRLTISQLFPIHCLVTSCFENPAHSEGLSVLHQPSDAGPHVPSAEAGLRQTETTGWQCLMGQASLMPSMRIIVAGSWLAGKNASQAWSNSATSSSDSVQWRSQVHLTVGARSLIARFGQVHPSFLSR